MQLGGVAQDLQLGQRVTLELVALTDHPVGRGDHDAAATTDPNSSEYAAERRRCEVSSRTHLFRCSAANDAVLQMQGRSASHAALHWSGGRAASCAVRNGHRPLSHDCLEQR